VAEAALRKRTVGGAMTAFTARRKPRGRMVGVTRGVVRRLMTADACTGGASEDAVAVTRVARNRGVDALQGEKRAVIEACSAARAPPTVGRAMTVFASRGKPGGRVIGVLRGVVRRLMTTHARTRRPSEHAASMTRVA